MSRALQFVCALLLALCVPPFGARWAQAQPSATLPSALTAPTVISAPSTVNAPSARPEPDVSLDFDVSLEALFESQPLLKYLNGEARLHVELTANTTVQPPASDRLIVIDSKDARLGRVRLSTLQIRVESLAGQPASHLTVHATGAANSQLDLDLSVQLELDPVKAEARWLAGPLQGELHVQNLDLDKLTDDYPGLAMQGIATFSATVSGTTDAPVVAAELGARNMTYRTEPVGEVSLGWKLQDGIADWSLHWTQAQAEVLAATLRARLKSSLNHGILSWLDQEEIKVELHAPKLTPQLLRPFWIAPEDFAFWLSLDADASGPISDLHGLLHAQATVKSGAEPAEPFDMKLALGGALQTLQLELGKKLLNADLSTNVSLAALRAGTADLSSAAVHGTLSTDLPLQLLAPFIPRWLNGPRGRLVSNVIVTGSLRAPELKGDLRTVNASVAALPLSQRVEQLRIEGKFSGAALELSHLDGVLGTGRL